MPTFGTEPVLHAIMGRALRRLKQYATQLIQRTPISSELIGPPKSVVNSTLEWAGNFRPLNGEEASYQEVISSRTVQEKRPQTVEETIHWKFRKQYRRVQPASFVVTIPQGRVWGNAGAVITPDDRLLGDASREFHREGEENSVFRQLKLNPVKKIKGKVAVLATAGSSTYFHWMCDILPRIHLLRLAGKFDAMDYFIVNQDRMPFQEETLRILGIPEEKRIYCLNHWKFHLKAEELLVPSLPSKLDTVARWSCDFLKDHFGLNGGQEMLPKRIYVSRAKAANRRVNNEGQVLEILKGYGFETVYTEAMTVVEQARLFANVRCVVAPHGAGLTNLVFCQPGTKVVDVFSPNWVNPCYWTMSNQLDLEYHYLIGEGKRPPEDHDPVLKGDNIQVDTRALVQTLERALS